MYNIIYEMNRQSSAQVTLKATLGASCCLSPPVLLGSGDGGDRRLQVRGTGPNMLAQVTGRLVLLLLC